MLQDESAYMRLSMAFSSVLLRTLKKAVKDFLRISYEFLGIPYDFLRISYEFLGIPYDFLRISYETNKKPHVAPISFPAFSL